MSPSSNIDDFSVGSLVWVPANVELKRYNWINGHPNHISNIIKKWKFSSPIVANTPATSITSQIEFTKKPAVALILSNNIINDYEIMWRGTTWYVNKNDVFLIDNKKEI